MKRYFIVLVVSLLCGNGWASDTLTVLFTGDILLDRGVRKAILHGGIDRLLAPCDSLLASADVVVGNLECPATMIHQPMFKRYVFRGEPEWLYDLRRHGFTHLNLANNHSVDQGRAGLADTRRNVAAAGLIPVGAGPNMTTAAAPVLLAEHPRRVWLLASQRLALENFALLPDQESVSQEPLDTLLRRIRDLREADPESCILVTLHWGAEHRTRHTPQQAMKARRMIAAGADAVVGHHPHVLQESELFRGRMIFYSIGNFLFDQSNPINSAAGVVRVRVTKHQIESTLLPITIRHCTPLPAPSAAEKQASDIKGVP